MALTFSSQSQIAFKNISGKSQTDSSKGLVNEFYGYSFNLPSSNIWSSNISGDPTISALQGVTVELIADLELIPGSNGHGFLTKWPLNLPSVIDVKTGLTLSYGIGSLTGISSGDRVTNVISANFGFSYSAIPYTVYPTSPITPLDNKNWIYQYNPGIFYQDVITGTTPSNVKIYPYLGDILNLTNGFENIRVSATGTNDFYSITSTPIISTYSTNYLFLVDFTNSNTSSTASLNVNGIGTYSIKKTGTSGLVNLNVGEIVGATAGVTGPIYYLTFNGQEFQFYTTNPEQSSLSFTKPNGTNTTVGTLDTGASFDNVSIQNVFIDLLYGNELGNIVDFQLSDTSGYLNSLEVCDGIIP